MGENEGIRHWVGNSPVNKVVDEVEVDAATGENWFDERLREGCEKEKGGKVDLSERPGDVAPNR